MYLSKGNLIPSVDLYTKDESGVKKFNTNDFFSNKNILVFSVPGAFTSTCSEKHLPSYINNFDLLISKGIDAIACLSVNDIHVMYAWFKLNNALQKIDILADSHLKFSNQLGITNDRGDVLGLRALRSSFYVKNRIIDRVFIEHDGEYRVSSAENFLLNL